MATAESVLAKIQALIDSANTTTGGSNTDLTAAINALIAGYNAGGIDTSDATATASDMAEGVTAYVNGEKVTGTIPVKAPTYTDVSVSRLLNESLGINSILVKAMVKNDVLARANTEYSIGANATNFGDAIAEDVISGKTFTSTAGLKIPGTHVCSGGLDTSDATATAEDIRSGVSAYINGEKIDGSASDNTTTYTSFSGTPSGTIEITSNGTHDVTNYASATVNVPTGGTSGGIVVKSGSFTADNETSHTISTGLSSISYFMMKMDGSVSSTGFVIGSISVPGSTFDYTYCSSYSTYIKSYAYTTMTGTVNGGDFTYSGSSSSALYGTIIWTAIGTE